MKRALVLRAACALGIAFSVMACSGSNPTLPPGVTPVDGGLGERGIAQVPDTSPIEVGETPDAGKDVAKDAPLPSDAVAIDSSPASKVLVTIQSPVAVSAADGGAGGPPVIGRSDRLAPTVQVEVQPGGGDPTLDVVTSVKATITGVSAKAPSASINLNQTQYTVVPQTGSKVYIYADTPFDLTGVAGDFYDLQVTATTAGGAVGTATMRIFVDGGPVITILQPGEGAYVKGSVVVKAMVVDNRSGVSDVAISIGQYTIPPSAIDNQGSQYSTTIDFGSFNPPLDGPQLVTITAKNANGNTSIATRRITIDTTGPSITGTKPATGEMIGKIITIEAKVDDPAGVMKSSVVAVVAHGDIHFEVNLVQSADGQLPADLRHHPVT